MRTIEVDSTTNTVEVGYDELCGALAARDLRALWSLQSELMPNVPLPATQAWIWKWDTIYPLARRAGELVTLERGGDRRVLALANPGLRGLPFTSSTLWGAVQYLGPHESAPAHRHTPSAIRFVMTGSGVHTTVEGDACEMEPGDLILTPNWNWHDHTNRGDKPMVWFDGLDLPLVSALESVFFENHPEDMQPVLGRNLSQRRFGIAGLADPAQPGQDVHSPLLRYPWAETDAMLEAELGSSGQPMVTAEYRNPTTGGALVATFGCAMNRLFPGERTPTRRKTGSSIFVVFRGSGRSVVNGVLLDWSAGDIFVTPSWSAVDHQGSEPADLFEISDRPLLRALHLGRDELLEPQPVVETFEPR